MPLTELSRGLRRSRISGKPSNTSADMSGRALHAEMEINHKSVGWIRNEIYYGLPENTQRLKNFSNYVQARSAKMRDPSGHFAFHPRSLKAIPLLSIKPQEGKEGRRVRHLSRRPQTFSADLWVIERQRRPSSATSAEVFALQSTEASAKTENCKPREIYTGAATRAAKVF